MSVSVTPSTLLTVDEYILKGYKRAGLLPLEFSIGADTQWNGKAAHGRLTLNLIIEDLANHGFLNHFVAFEIVTLVAGDHNYTLDSDILNVVEAGSYIPASNGVETELTDGDTPVNPMNQHQWNMLSNKSSTGTPTRYFFDRNAFTNNLRIWPVPDEAGKLRLRTHRLPGSNSAGSDNVDLKRHWGQFIINALAYEFMSDAKLSIEERQLVRSDRNNALEQIKTYETDNEPPDFCFTHSSPWGNSQ